MKSLLATLVLFATGMPAGNGLPRPEQRLFIVRGPTIFAFFTPLNQEDLKRGPDANEALSDFQWYAAESREPLAKLGIELKQVYARSFRVSAAGKVVNFTPKRAQVGYYLIAPGKKARVEYGVKTDNEIEQDATKYFRTRSK